MALLGEELGTGAERKQVLIPFGRLRVCHCEAAGVMPAHNCEGTSDDDTLEAEEPGGWADF